VERAAINRDGLEVGRRARLLRLDRVGAAKGYGLGVELLSPAHLTAAADGNKGDPSPDPGAWPLLWGVSRSCRAFGVNVHSSADSAQSTFPDNEK
jgi:hypothetical protein